MADEVGGKLLSPSAADGLGELPAQGSLVAWCFRQSEHGIKWHLSWVNVFVVSLLVSRASVSLVVSWELSKLLFSCGDLNLY